MRSTPAKYREPHHQHHNTTPLFIIVFTELFLRGEKRSTRVMVIGLIMCWWRELRDYSAIPGQRHAWVFSTSVAICTNST
jgi:hypothetical protein